MDLRAELRPPELDPDLLARLAELANRLGAPQAEQNSNDLSEFNRLAGTQLSADEFQGIYESEDGANWVKCILYERHIQAVPDATLEELVEVARRAMPDGGYFEQHEEYMAVLDANSSRRNASNLIYYPPDYDHRTGTWDGGRSIGEYNPSPEQIVSWAMEREPQFIVSPDGETTRETL